MRIRTVFVYMMVVLLLSASTSALAQGTDEEAETECDITYLFNAWARPAAAGTPNSAVYGLLVNLQGDMDTLVSASSGAAEVVELHEVTMGEGDVMQMRPVEGGLAIPPATYLELKPGGLHIMLINLTEPLVEGEQIELTLTFEHAGDVMLTVPVVDMTAMMLAGEGAMEGLSSGEMPGAMDATEPEEPAPMWDEACATIYVVDPWVRPAMPGMPTSAAYGLLLNLTTDDEMLISAESAAAEALELHEMTMGEGDVMQMRPVEGGIAIPAGGATLLQPGGLHIMMINLAGMLADGETVDFTLTFAEYGDMPLTVPVREPQPAAAHSGIHGN